MCILLHLFAVLLGDPSKGQFQPREQYVCVAIPSTTLAPGYRATQESEDIGDARLTLCRVRHPKDAVIITENAYAERLLAVAGDVPEGDVSPLTISAAWE